jgi:hypothetical protein
MKKTKTKLANFNQNIDKEVEKGCKQYKIYFEKLTSKIIDKLKTFSSWEKYHPHSSDYIVPCGIRFISNKLSGLSASFEIDANGRAEIKLREFIDSPHYQPNMDLLNSATKGGNDTEEAIFEKIPIIITFLKEGKFPKGYFVDNEEYMKNSKQDK